LKETPQAAIISVWVHNTWPEGTTTQRADTSRHHDRETLSTGGVTVAGWKLDYERVLDRIHLRKVKRFPHQVEQNSVMAAVAMLARQDFLLILSLAMDPLEERVEAPLAMALAG
jgi:hypothetical protein